MTTALLDRRCFNHAAREAAVRCPECARFYCRECVVEHLGRMICSGCVARAEAGGDASRFPMVRWSLLAAAGFLLAWMIFYYLGVMFARIPSTFFE
jgi:hypothetical protein